MKKLLFSLPLFLFFLSCKENAESVQYDSAAVAVEATTDTEDLKEKTIAMDLAQPASPKKQESKIIKTASLKFETDDLNNSFSIIQKATSKYKAIIQNDVSGKDYNSVFRNVNIRMPNQYFDAFINEISQGVKHFDTKEISQEDVTEEYIDIESRMNSKKKLEERYLQLLSKANKVSEMLEIEKKLSEIREEIEAKEGQLKYMQNRISMSTISIEMYTNNASEAGATVSYGGKIWNSIKEGFYGLSNFVLSLISIWPLIAIFVTGFILIKKRFFKKKA